MGGVAAAYLATLAVISVRWYKGAGQAPPPISFLGATAIYAGCGILARADETFGSVTAWAFFVGALVAPNMGTTVSKVYGQVPTQVASAPPAPNVAPGVSANGPGSIRYQNTHPYGQGL